MLIQNHQVIEVVNRMAKLDPIGRRKTNNQMCIMILIIFTITEKQLNNVVVKKSHVASLGGN